MRAKFLKSIFKISCVVTLVALVVLCLSACGDKVQKGPSETVPTETTYSEVKYFQYAFGVSIEKSSILDDVPISFYDKNGETFLRDIVEVSKDKANYEGLCTFNKEDDAPVRYLLTSLEHKGLTLVLDFDDKSVVSKVSGYIDSDAENRIVLEFDYNTDGNISKIKTSKGVYREYLYDDNGNAVEVVICNAEGSVTQRIKNEYDDNGYCINVETYNAHNNYTGGYEFKYDENVIEGIVYNNYKNITSKYVREFDDNRNIVKNTDYNSRGEVVRINGYKYNGNRQKIEQTFYSTDGAILNVERYEYDSKINLVKTSTYNKDGLLVFDIVNEYGDDGNLLTVSNITYSSDGSKDCVEVKDSKDRLLSHSKFYADGEMWYQATYEYPNDNIYKETIYYPELSSVDGCCTVTEKYPSGKTKQQLFYNKNGVLIKDIMYKDSLEPEQIYEKYYRDSGELQYCKEYIDRPSPYNFNRLYKITHYHKNGAISNIVEFNALGDQVYSHYYKPDGSEGMEIYEYYDNGQLEYYTIGSFEGVVFESAYYAEDGILYNKKINYEDGSAKYFEYNDYHFEASKRGHLMQKTVGVFDTDGTGTITYTNYDENGNITGVEVVNRPIVH